MKTLKKSEQATSPPLTSSAEGSPVSHTALLASVPAPMIHEIYGLSSHVSSQPSSQLGCLLRTALISTTPYLRTSAVVWKVKVTKSNRSVFQLVVAAPNIGVSDGSSLPTPRASDGKGGGVAGRPPGKMNLRDWWKERTGQSTPDPRFSEWLMGFPAGWTDLGS